MTRRTLFRWARMGAAALPLTGSSQAQAPPAQAADELPEAQRKKKLRVVFVGAHVDDWVDCAGTLARYTRLGHEALCISFTPGDSQSMADQRHMPVEKLAALRSEHADKGTKILGARMLYLNQHNQRMRVDPDTYAEFNKTLLDIEPDVVFTMWPIEFHPDHRAAANLAYNAWLQSGMQFALFFCETPGGREMQPQQFVPNRRVDVTLVADQKRDSYLANEFIGQGWPEADLWAKFRGMEYGCQYAEAFVQVSTVAAMRSENLYPHRWYYGGLRLADN